LFLPRYSSPASTHCLQPLSLHVFIPFVTEKVHWEVQKWLLPRYSSPPLRITVFNPFASRFYSFCDDCDSHFTQESVLGGTKIVLASFLFRLSVSPPQTLRSLFLPVLILGGSSFPFSVLRIASVNFSETDRHTR
jgi:hypothetical protein